MRRSSSATASGVFLGAVCCFSVFVDTAHAAGTTSAVFLRLQPDARTAALGETGAASTDVSAVFTNPAGLNENGGGATFSHASWLGDITFQSVAVTRKLRGGTGGIGVVSLGVPPMRRFDNTGLPQPGEFTARDLAIVASYARIVKDIPVGASLKYISSTIDGTTASSFAADLGARLGFTFAGTEMTAALVLQNIGPAMKFNRESFSLPVTARAGVSFNASRNIAIDVDIDKGLGLDPAAHLGAEYRHPFGGANALAARLGYMTGVKGVDGVAGVTSGVGIELGSFGIDYAFVPYGDLAQTHRLSLNYDF